MTAASDWQTGAACASFDPGPWDPAPTREGPRQKERREQMALDVCNGRPAIGDRPALPACPIKAACRARAMDYGIWGGTTELDRKSRGMACSEVKGTEAGANRHKRAGEAICPDCLIGQTRARAVRLDIRRAQRRRARDQKATDAATQIAEEFTRAMPVTPDPEWVTSARLTLLNLEARKASA